MTERQLAIRKVEMDLLENTARIKSAKLNSIYCEVNIKTYQKNIKYQDKLHKDIINKFELQIDSAVKNAKASQKVLDKLLEEKEKLHLEFKKVLHHGEVECEFCHKFYTPAGLKRHQNNCNSKPVNKKVLEHEAEIALDAKDIEARKAALKKELAELNKKPKAKPKPKPKPPILPPPPNIEEPKTGIGALAAKKKEEIEKDE